MATAMSEDLAALSFEQAIGELDGLIARLEGGKIDLADAVAAYERGMELAAHCGALLDRTEATITQLVSGPAGTVEVAIDVTEQAVRPAPQRARREPAAEDPGLFPGVTPAPATPAADVDPDDVPF